MSVLEELHNHPTCPECRPLREHRAWLEGCVNRAIAREPQEDPGRADYCLVVPPLNDATCWLADGHTGPHEWEDA